MIGLSKNQRKQLKLWYDSHILEMRDINYKLERNPSLILRLFKPLETLNPDLNILSEKVFSNNEEINEKALNALLKENIYNNRVNREKFNSFFKSSKGKKIFAWIYYDSGIEFMLNYLETLKDHPIAKPHQKHSVIMIEKLIINATLNSNIKNFTELLTAHEKISYIVRQSSIERLVREYHIDHLVSDFIRSKLLRLVRFSAKSPEIAMWFYVLKHENLIKKDATIEEFSYLIKKLVANRWNVPGERVLQSALKKIEITKNAEKVINKTYEADFQKLVYYFNPYNSN